MKWGMNVEQHVILKERWPLGPIPRLDQAAGVQGAQQEKMGTGTGGEKKMSSIMGAGTRA